MGKSACPSVLIVDDDPVCLELTRAVLENAGFAVISRSSPLGLSTVFSRTPPGCRSD